MHNSNIKNLSNVINLNNRYNDIPCANITINDDNISEYVTNINNLLGNDFQYTMEFDNIYKNKNIVCFSFINKSKIKNIDKSKYISDKIDLLKKNNFFEIEDIKISGIGRFIKIHLKSIDDYEKEKILLLKDFINKIHVLDEKIEKIEKNKKIEKIKTL